MNILRNMIHTPKEAKNYSILCSVTNCNNPSRAVGLCRSHYMRKWRYNDEGVQLQRIRNDDEKRFNSRIKKIENGCWIWQGKLDARGYGRMLPDMAHRWSYKHFKGEIPDGLVIHHKCFIPSCVNPEHLEVATHRENIIEKGKSNAAYLNSKKEICINGHSLEDAYLQKRKYGIARNCRQCQKERTSKYLSSRYPLTR